LWSRNGRELFFRDFGGAVVAVPVASGRDFAPGRPSRVLEDASYSGGGGRGGGRTYDVSPDGQRFLMVKSSGAISAPELVVVMNWFEELRRLAPVD
jgi:serine/threonine-protein kinase